MYTRRLHFHTVLLTHLPPPPLYAQTATAMREIEYISPIECTPPHPTPPPPDASRDLLRTPLHMTVLGGSYYPLSPRPNIPLIPAPGELPQAQDSEYFPQ